MLKTTPTDILGKLVFELKQLPGIGEKTATRLAYFILRQPEHFSESLATAILHARKMLHSCVLCCTFSEEETCEICKDPQRMNEVVCVVEEPPDVVAFEKARSFNGKYHVLHGALSPLDGVDE